MEGWVKFHRKIEEWEWYTDSNTFRVFFHLVLRANHKPNKWRGIDIDKGQLITSRDKLADQLNISVQQVRTSLKRLESTKEITIKSTNRYTLVTVENYTIYQTKDEVSTSKLTINQPTDNQPITTNKNDKNDKNDNNNIYIVPLVKHWNSKDMLNNHKSDSKGIVDSITKNIVTELDYNQSIVGIDNYYEALIDSTFYYSHGFKLDKFISQSNGYKDWIDNSIRKKEFNDHLKKKGVNNNGSNQGYKGGPNYDEEPEGYEGISVDLSKV